MAVEIFEVIKVIFFAYITALPYIVSLWPMTIMPEISRINFHQKTEYEQNQAVNFYYTTYFYGMLIGTLCWPTLIQYLSKRNSLLFGQLIQAFCTLGLFFTDKIYPIYALRFFMGFGMNINSVGKDFIFEFSHDQYVQWTFSFKSIFAVLALFLSPLLGYELYQWTGKSFNLINLYIAILYFGSTFMFYVIFYIFWSPKPHTLVTLPELDEEKVGLVDK